MPSFEFVCDQCGHRFTQLFFKGEPDDDSNCTRCGSRHVKRQPGPRSLFEDGEPVGGQVKETN